MKSILILIDYFGSWPKWFPVFLASCKFNDTIDWIITTDCEIPADAPANVRFVKIGYAEYIAHVSRTLNINFNPAGNYKICDIRPAYGDLYADEIKNYDYYGYSDLDVIYGDIRDYFDDEVLSHDVISCHAHMLSGHLALFKNTERVRKAYLSVPRWKEYFENPESTRFDEDVFSCLFIERGWFHPDWIPHNLLPALDEVPRLADVNVWFAEYYSTVFHPGPWHDGCPDHPEVWFWKDGLVYNDRNEGWHYLYLHLMNFQSMRWCNPECRTRHIPWKDNPDMRFTLAGEETNGVRIDWKGIHALPAS